jgi:hypothetical protein
MLQREGSEGEGTQYPIRRFYMNDFSELSRLPVDKSIHGVRLTGPAGNGRAFLLKRGTSNRRCRRGVSFHMETDPFFVLQATVTKQEL